MFHHIHLLFIIKDYNKIKYEYKCRKQYYEFIRYYKKIIN